MRNLRLRGSYTIEAVYIMGITMMTFAIAVNAAYRIKAETIGAMELHGQVEALRYQEDDQASAIRRASRGDGWSLEITVPVYDPEAWLRMISLLE